jgi:isopenicillin-N epimerase
MASEHARHWDLDPRVTFLNHGSYGACPRAVLEAQTAWRARLEAQPVQFLSRDLPGLLADARSEVGAFVGADPDDLAFVTNATGATNAVVRSLTFEPGDEILTTDHEYNAILNVLRHVAARDGARVVVARIPFPPRSADEVVEPILDAATARTRLAVVSHVTSPTAIVVPVERLVPAFAERGIDVLVDGAHAPGMLPLTLDALGAAYYTGNLHKWVCAPKGSAFLHVRRDRQATIRPTTISHGANAPTGTDPPTRFRAEFDWQGTGDPTAWLSASAAIRAVGAMLDGGWPAVMARNRSLAHDAGRRLAAVLGMGRPAPDDLLGAMVALPMPEDGPLGGPPAAGASSPLDTDPLQDRLLESFGVEVPINPWPVPAAESAGLPRRLIRVSMALHNDVGDVDRLIEALATIATGQVPA